MVGAQSWFGAENVSMLQLITTPEKYDGRVIRVLGFLWLELEGNALYVHREDYENRLLFNRIGLTPPSEDYSALRGQYVIVEGGFNANRACHLSMCKPRSASDRPCDADR